MSTARYQYSCANATGNRVAIPQVKTKGGEKKFDEKTCEAAFLSKRAKAAWLRGKRI